MYANSRPKPMFTYNNGMSGGGENIYCDLVSTQCFKNINTILQSYASGNFSYVIQNLNINDYNTLAVGLYKLQNLNYPCYEQIRKTLTYTLEGLQQCVFQAQLLQQLQQQIIIYKEGYEILHDNTLLREYIEQLRKSMQAFPNMSVTVDLLNIRPEYLEYINLYGLPENLIFDPDKLAEIIAGANPPQLPLITNNSNVDFDEPETPEEGNIQETFYNNFEYSSLIDDPTDGAFN